MNRWFKRVLIVSAVLAIGVLGFFLAFIFNIIDGPGFQNLMESAGSSHDEARTEFRMTLNNIRADAACLDRAMIVSAADIHGFDWAPMPEGLQFCHSPAGLQDWLRVDISPPLAFSTADENAAMFAFDAQGCSVDWFYSSC